MGLYTPDQAIYLSAICEVGIRHKECKGVVFSIAQLPHPCECPCHDQDGNR